MNTETKIKQYEEIIEQLLPVSRACCKFLANLDGYELKANVTAKFKSGKIATKDIDIEQLISFLEGKYKEIKSQ